MQIALYMRQEIKFFYLEKKKILVGFDKLCTFCNMLQSKGIEFWVGSEIVYKKNQRFWSEIGEQF